MRVVKLEIENYMGIKAVQITPEGNVIRIEGKNEAGKSSIIDAIWTAIGGADEMPNNPIRTGETDASILVDLGNLTVHRRFTEKGSYLDVRNNDGFKAPSPQATLDELFTKVSMDPQAFIDMKPGARKELLLDLTGNRGSIETLENNRTIVFNARTEVNRDIKNLEGKLYDAPEDEEVAEKSVAELMDKLKEAREVDENLNKMEAEANQLNEYAEIEHNLIEAREKEIRELEEVINNSKRTIADSLNKSRHFKKMVANAPGSEVETIETEIAEADEYNKRVRDIMDARELRKELESTQEQSKKYTASLKKIDKDKFDLLKSAKLPLDNLTVNDATILIGEIPFDDLSYSQQIKASMSIGMALNPKLRVLKISKGGEFDSKSKTLIEDFAEKNDCQIWMECVADEQDQGIFIKDGEIVEGESE